MVKQETFERERVSVSEIRFVPRSFLYWDLRLMKEFASGFPHLSDLYANA